MPAQRHFRNVDQGRTGSCRSFLVHPDGGGVPRRILSGAPQRLPRFAEHRSGLDALLERLKLLPCGHCGAYDTLIGHGFLRSYIEHGSDWAIRGRRFFCSNRGRRPGCGRTLSVLLAELLSGFLVTTVALWQLFCRLSEGTAVESAARASGWPQCARSAYRIAVRIRIASASWRTWLSAHSVPPACSCSEPLAQLRAHFQAVLGEQPLAALQLATDRPLL
jgi:hypothetical protein